MFLLAAERAGAARPLVIGDRLDTDLKGARAAAIPGLMVLTGVNDAADAVAAGPGERPCFVGEDLSCLAEAHPAPGREGDWHIVRESRARVVRGAIEMSGATGIDAVRAACAAAWEAADTGVTFAIERDAVLGLL
jgi:glycerol-1-phosphatase